MSVEVEIPEGAELQIRFPCPDCGGGEDSVPWCGECDRGVTTRWVPIVSAEIGRTTLGDAVRAVALKPPEPRIPPR